MRIALADVLARRNSHFGVLAVAAKHDFAWVAPSLWSNYPRSEPYSRIARALSGNTRMR
jgi:hypothetical protein